MANDKEVSKVWLVYDGIHSAEYTSLRFVGNLGAIIFLYEKVIEELVSKEK